MKRSEKQNLELIIRRMRADRSVDAPSSAITYAKNLYRSRVTEPELSVVRRVFAALRVDLMQNRAALGERSAAAGQARQMLFETGDNAVDLRIRADVNLFDIRGQILGESFAGADVELANDQSHFITKTDDGSGFSFTGLPGGEFSLNIRGTKSEIHIQQLFLR